MCSPTNVLVTLNEGTEDGHDPGLCDGVTQDLRMLQEGHTAVHQGGQLHSTGEGGGEGVCVSVCVVSTCACVCAHFATMR